MSELRSPWRWRMSVAWQSAAVLSCVATPSEARAQSVVPGHEMDFTEGLTTAEVHWKEDLGVGTPGRWPTCPTLEESNIRDWSIASLAHVKSTTDVGAELEVYSPAAIPRAAEHGLLRPHPDVGGRYALKIDLHVGRVPPGLAKRWVKIIYEPSQSFVCRERLHGQALPRGSILRIPITRLIIVDADAPGHLWLATVIAPPIARPEDWRALFAGSLADSSINSWVATSVESARWRPARDQDNMGTCRESPVEVNVGSRVTSVLPGGSADILLNDQGYRLYLIGRRAEAKRGQFACDTQLPRQFVVIRNFDGK